MSKRIRAHVAASRLRGGYEFTMLECRKQVGTVRDSLGVSLTAIN